MVLLKGLEMATTLVLLWNCHNNRSIAVLLCMVSHRIVYK